MISIVENINELTEIREQGVQLRGNGRNTEVLRTWLGEYIVDNTDNIIVIADRQNKPAITENPNNKNYYIVTDNIADDIAKIIEKESAGKGHINRSSLYVDFNNRYYSDSNSVISIDDLTYISNSYMAAWSASDISIGKNAKIYNSLIECEDNASIFIADGAFIDKGTQIVARHNSKVYIEQDCHIGSGEKIIGIENSEIRIGNNTVIGDYGEIISKSGAEITIGCNSSLSRLNRLGAKDRKISIGDDCLFSYDIALDQNHQIVEGKSGTYSDDKRDTVIGNHVWIGKGSFIMSGTVVGDGAIIGALSFVHNKYPGNSEIAGVPAKIIKENITWEK